MELTRIPVPVDGTVPDGRTNAYLVDSLLIDPAAQTAELDSAVADHSINHIAVTHTHPDHVGGVSAYADRCNATVWAKAGHTGRFEAATGWQPDRTFAAGVELGPAEVLETPGHAVDHVCFGLNGAAIVGDLATATGSVFVGPDDGDMRTYLVSLRRLLVSDFGILYPGHGQPIESPEETLIRLLTHRRDREEQVRAAVAAGATTLDEIVTMAYEKELGGHRDQALLTVEAHLEKLSREGHVDWPVEEGTAGGF